MKKQIIIGLATEGSTDVRFLKSIVMRTFETICCQSSQTIEIFDPIPLNKASGTITDKALNFAQQAQESGIIILCYHADADDINDQKAFTERIDPAFEIIKQTDENLGKNLIAIVPVQMTESWMLADTELLKKELGSQKSDQELGIDRHPESVSDPKEVIAKAIEITRQDYPQRRRHKLTIQQLYQPIGQKIQLEELEKLSSYQKFRNAVQNLLTQLNYLTQ